VGGAGGGGTGVALAASSAASAKGDHRKRLEGKSIRRGPGKLRRC
jgi:hypothetical protein